LLTAFREKNMTKASDDLVHEHDAILFTFKVLEAILKRIAGGETVERRDLAELVDFLKIFADKCHHGKEEGFLFPALEEAGIANKGGPIGAMLAEHEQGRGYIRRMSESLDDQKSFAKPARAYIDLLRAHIDKENKVLFPMGDARLSREKQSELLARFETFEDEVIGKGRHEELHRMLDRFEKKFL
jgi:hemerythrin-like domain-containing protein